MMLHVVTFGGPFGFLKPWTAVRDGVTYSQQFLTPSTLAGMALKLGTGPILRHRLSFGGMSGQQEATQSRAACAPKAGMPRKRGALLEPGAYAAGGILTRYVLVEPRLHLAFAEPADAARAACQHLCLCRNEDVVLPEPAGPRAMPADAFDALDGFEFRPGEGEGAFLAGYDRYAQGAPRPMWGRLEIVGNAVRDR